MSRRMIRRALCAGLLLWLPSTVGCAHQREAFFPPASPGSVLAPKGSASASPSARAQGSAIAKPSRVEQSARRGHSGYADEPFDFDSFRE